MPDEIHEFIGRMEERTKNLHEKMDERTARMERAVEKLGDVVTEGFQKAEDERETQWGSIRTLETEVNKAKHSIKIIKAITLSLVVIWGAIKGFFGFK